MLYVISYWEPGTSLVVVVPQWWRLVGVLAPTRFNKWMLLGIDSIALTHWHWRKIENSELLRTENSDIMSLAYWIGLYWFCATLEMTSNIMTSFNLTCKFAAVAVPAESLGRVELSSMNVECWILDLEWQRSMINDRYYLLVTVQMHDYHIIIFHH